MDRVEQEKILKLLCFYILMQPLLDILSNLYIEGIIPFGISTVVKPLFVFSYAHNPMTHINITSTTTM